MKLSRTIIPFFVFFSGGGVRQLDSVVFQLIRQQNQE